LKGTVSNFAADFSPMSEVGNIEHQGIVSKTANGKVFVNLTNVSNCSSCHVQSMCQVSDVDKKEIEIVDLKSHNFKKGDKVEVSFSKSQGPKALFLGYLLPFLFVIATLFITSEISGDEVFAGISSLLILIPYYIVLYIFRSKLKKEFTFKLKASMNS
jgi:sigma-E factor negative regulatory protein RseC